VVKISLQSLTIIINGGILKVRDEEDRMDKIRNINEAFGESVEFDSVNEMIQAIYNCGYELPEDGLVEGRDYEQVLL
jgi:hypothetical protein